MTSRWLSRLVFACFIVALLFVPCYSPFSMVFYCRGQPNAWFTYWWIDFCSLQTAIHDQLMTTTNIAEIGFSRLVFACFIVDLLFIHCY